jgi:hypothetical protein
MACKTVLLMGKPGSGKTQSGFPLSELSIKGLNPSETFMINIVKKELPLKGADTLYKTAKVENNKIVGNMINTDDPDKIIKSIELIDKQPAIKNILIDDSQFLFGGEFFKRALEKGYDKFNVIGEKGFRLYLWLVNNRANLRDDLYIYILTHSEEYEMPNSGQMVIEPMTIGQMVNNYCKLEGLFSIVLHCVKIRNKTTKEIEYKIKTKPEYEKDATRSPYGMFKDLYIPNDLGAVRDIMTEFYK